MLSIFSVYHFDRFARMGTVISGSARRRACTNSILSGSNLSRIHLNHQDNFFSFAFAALDFTNPQKNQYAYKLEGLDRDWVQAGNKHEANYTHVSPGKYIFRVKGANNDGVWNERGASVRVIIMPAFWQTWRFGLLVLAIIAGIGQVLHKYRTAKKLEVNDKLDNLLLRMKDAAAEILV